MDQSTFHARGVGDLLDAAFRLYRLHFKTFVSIAGVLLVPFAVLQLLALASPGLIRVISVVQNLLVVSVLFGALTAASSAAYVGQPLSVGDAYRVGGRKWLSVGGSFVLIGLIIVLPFVLIAGVVFFVDSQFGILPTVAELALAALALATVPFMLLFFTRYVVAVPAIVLENVNAGQSLKRSRELVQGTFWHVFWCAIATGLLVLLITKLPAGVADAFASFAHTDFETSIRIASFVLSQVGLILALPFQNLVYTLLYYDLRIRKEGYDLELRASEFESTASGHV